MKDKILVLIIVFLASAFGVCFTYSKLSADRDYKNYSIGLEAYKKEDYVTAYHSFKKITMLSEIKSPAMFRQARCATHVGDINGAKRNYKRLLFLYPNSPLYLVSEYNLAMLLYEIGNNSARKYFAHIIKYYPESDYALASEYYVASIDLKKAQKTRFHNKRKKLKQKSLNHFIRYVKLSPDGRFAKDSIEKIKEIGIVLTRDDNFELAKSCYLRELYNEASNYFKESPMNIAWAKYAKNEFKRENYSYAKTLVENGLKSFSETVEKEDVYSVIDSYVSLSDNKLKTVSEMHDKYAKTSCADYLLYLKAKYSSEEQQSILFEQLYNKYPASDFSAEALYKAFFAQIDKENYKQAIKLGQKHIANFEASDTAPAVLFWLGKIYERKKNPIQAKSYYKNVISKYPDSYYSYRAYSILHKNKGLLADKSVTKKPVVFPRVDKKEKEMASKLIKLEDYDFISELYKNDKFVQSWIAYKQGKKVRSCIIAQNAMKDIYPKPKYEDVRWRLVYPLNYIEFVEEYKGGQDPLLIMSIIREESHFDKEIVSCVGAKGLMQLMPETAEEIAIINGLPCNLFEPENNIRLGSLYFAMMKGSLSNNDAYAIMAYNGGAFTVTNWIKRLKYRDIDDFVEKIPYSETQSYVKKVLKSYWNYSNIY